MLILFILSAIIALCLSLNTIVLCSGLLKIIAIKTENLKQLHFRNAAINRLAFIIFSVICALATAIFASHYFYQNI